MGSWRAAGPSGQVEEDHRCSWYPSQHWGAERSRALAAGGQDSAGEGWLEALGVSEPQSPVSVKWGGGINREED